MAIHADPLGPAQDRVLSINPEASAAGCRITRNAQAAERGRQTQPPRHPFQRGATGECGASQRLAAGRGLVLILKREISEFELEVERSNHLAGRRSHARGPDDGRDGR